MEPTQPTPSASALATPSPGREAIVEFIRTQRSTAATVLGVLAVICLAAGVFLAIKAFRVTTVPADKPLTNEKEKADFGKQLELPKAPEEIENLKKIDFTIGWFGCLLAFMISSAGALWLMARVPLQNESSQRTEARVLILSVGMCLGVLLMLIGLVYFYRWSDSLSKWLDTKEMHELQRVLSPVMMVVLGIGLVFAAIQPARSEERTNSTVRKIVYGSNFGLTVMLLLVALIVVNVVIAVKVPNKLDTTENGFYEISERTKQLLRELKEPITAYALIPSDSGRQPIEDMRQLLLAFQDVAGGKFRVKFLDEMANRNEVRELIAKYPQATVALAQPGVSGIIVLSVGEDGKRHAVIPDTEFSTTQGDKPAFQGESRLFRELVILSDTETKPIVYFTQSNGEMSIDPAAQVPDDRKITSLAKYLEKNYLEVRPLNFTLENPTIPADAAIVVVAEPRVPFSPDAAAALKKYMFDTGKKGRLVVLAGIVPGPNGQGVTKTGLEDLLREMNVGLGNRFIYTFPREEGETFLECIAGFTDVAVKSGNEIAVTMYQAAPTVTFDLPREVEPLTTAPGFQAIPLLGSTTATWIEDDRIPEAMLRETYVTLNRNPAIREAKRLTRGVRSLGVAVSDTSTPNKPTPFAVVYGSGEFVSDRAVQKRRNAVPVALMGVSIDWLRNRPSIGGKELEAKRYSEYQFPKPSTVDATRLEYLPIALALLTIIGLGGGVWIIRRS
ncbi:MAG: GldG family protein [Planctomycetes bacterium]|nr:GldG family protein [Planctomycetota bacterium]